MRVERWSACHYRDRGQDESLVVFKEGESIELISELISLETLDASKKGNIFGLCL